MAFQSNELEEMRAQYEAMKKSQLTLTEMNKKLIERHSQEVDKLNSQLRETSIEIGQKRRKLDKYAEIIKSFSQQLEIFESFQQSTNAEIKRLKDCIKEKERENKFLQERFKNRVMSPLSNHHSPLKRSLKQNSARTKSPLVNVSRMTSRSPLHRNDYVKSPPSRKSSVRSVSQLTPIRRTVTSK